MDNLVLVRHPLIQAKLTKLRDKRTDRLQFRQILEELTALMVYEITRDFPVRPVEVETPFERTQGVELARPVVLVPILRAGIVMLDGVLSLIPSAYVGHIGLYRDPATLKPVQYFVKLPPNLAEALVIVVDPMLATGGSAVHAVQLVKERGGRDIRFLCLVAAPEGVRAMARAHPDVPVYAAALDRELDPHGYIRPGLGDAGDRLFGT
ncbi:MAG: uracil phosphoribosyltransferase [Candidatus Bipolaricaulota bacterium]|nr:uracil phosphoribosyltransferase [Candidatus Bipolaricaulota bacterium]MCX7844526.1 uracil phosphoribosyltransferase [Candidatus Bipolaricaulota bacterium]MDW8152385.1 uracil phosphoribosyltransferase [Candidatus Bipolaricaulota bacterium]